MTYVPSTAQVTLLALGCASCGSSMPVTGPSPIAPQRTVWGSVQNTAFQPIAGAQVAIVGTSLSTMTGGNGRYELTGSMASPTTVRVTKEGYVVQTRTAGWQTCTLGTSSCGDPHTDADDLCTGCAR